MNVFLRLLAEKTKDEALAKISSSVRSGVPDPRVFWSNPELFLLLPGSSFAYWVDATTRQTFATLPRFEGARTRLVAKRGVNSNDDFRFLRTSWEVERGSRRWVIHPKGGQYSPFYADLPLVLDWHPDGRLLEAERITDRVYSHAIVPSRELYFRPGLTWSLRTKSRLSMRVMPAQCVFGSKGPAVIEFADDTVRLLAALAICNSRLFHSLIEIQLAAADAKPGGAAHSFEVGVIQRTPFPDIDDKSLEKLAALARQAWSIKRALDTVEETSRAFWVPAALRTRLGDYDPPSIDAELTRILAEIDAIAFDLYGFSADDRAALQARNGTTIEDDAESNETADGDADDEDSASPIDKTAALLSWAAGVAFGRFDWRLATGERAAPREPEPFDSLPAKSPGRLLDGAEQFHCHAGILADDPGHPHDLARLVEEVLARVEAPVPQDVRRWLQRDFFPFHLQRYSKSRRKAPIYWPISTTSGSYTLWLFYPNLTSQTPYTAVNDFIEPKLKQLGQVCAALRNKANARSREDDKRLEALQTLEGELIDLRDTLLQIAPTYRPNHDDGIQIIAAPFWPLFRHKPWQKVLKETWVKLEKGDYDWAHLALAYWPDRVREKCKTDKSLAIAHDLEDLYSEPAPKAKRRRSGQAMGADE